MNKRFWHNQKGFTLIETIMTVFVTSILMISVSGIFVQVLREQKHGFGAQKVQENALYVLEALAREIRVSKLTAGSDNTCTSPTLAITHPVNGVIAYFLQDGVIQRQVQGVVAPLSTNDVQFSDIRFCVKDSDTNDQQARVTIVTRLKYITNIPLDEAEFQLQTTITLRDYETEL